MTVTVYVPAANPLAIAAVPPVLHAKENAPVPPEPEAVNDPSLPPKHATSWVSVIVAFTVAEGSPMVCVADTVVELASVTVTVYVPAVNPVTVLLAELELLVVEALLQTYP